MRKKKKVIDATPRISFIKGREILDSRGNPTVEVEVVCNNGVLATASVPSGASTGEKEAIELRDGKDRYLGKGVLTAVYNINSILGPAFINMNVTDQKEIDKKLLELDGTKNKSKYGANAILGISIACLKAAALSSGKELYKYIGEGEDIPELYMNVINGGAHANNNLDIQEFMIVPEADAAAERIRIGSEIFHTLKKLLKGNKHSTAVGDEGGFAPNLKNTEEALNYILYAVKQAGYEGKVKVALDVAANSFYDKNQKSYLFEGKKYNSDELATYYQELVNKYPISSIEDPFEENDWYGFTVLTQKLFGRVQVVGDDLLVTNKELLQKAIEEKAVSAIIIKPNQIGSYSEMIETIELAKKNNIKTMMSHRSGETNDTYIADFAVGLNIPQMKTGSLSRGERICKYNRLMKIETQILNSGVTIVTNKKDFFSRAKSLFGK